MSRKLEIILTRSRTGSKLRFLVDDFGLDQESFELFVEELRAKYPSWDGAEARIHHTSKENQ